MKAHKLFLFTACSALSLLCFAAGASGSAAQNANVSERLQVLPVSGNIYMITGGGANVTASIGRDGVFLVDSGSAAASDKVLETIRQLSAAISAPAPLTPCVGLRCGGFTSAYGWSSPAINAIIGSPAPPKPIRYIVNTTIDPDHTGGNARIAAAGSTFTGGNVAATITDAGAGATVIAHENALMRMMEPGGSQPQRGLPNDTYYLPSYKLSHFFNGEGIQIFHQPRARTDGDSIVYFRFSDVISAGDILSTTSYPVIDVKKGGSIQGVIDGLNRILDIAIPEFRSQGGTLVIPGHGRVCDTGDVANYRNMVVIIRDRIQSMIKEGMSLAQIKAARPIRDYDGRYGSNKDWTSDMFIEAVYQSLTEKK
jgi:glyoxylase-like metal-dependent hydrolase (beta-lactamase superfamily II)